MRAFCRNVVLGAAAVTLLALGTTTHAAITISKCSGGKIKCAAGLDGGKGKCNLLPDKKGLAIDPLCVGKAQTKYDGGTAPAKGCFAKLEAKVPSDCGTTGDSAATQGKVDAYLTDLFTEIDTDFPAPALNKCGAGKAKCADGYGLALLKCYNKQATKGIVDPICLSKAVAKYNGGTAPAKGCFAKIEAKVPNDCATTGDSAAIQAKVEAYVNDLVCSLKPDLGTCPVGTCPTQIAFTGTSTGGVLDTGWTGQGHDATTISKGTVTVTVSTCTGATPPCGTCTYAGPVENGAGQLHVRRCTGDNTGANGSWVQCTSNADCTGTGNQCVFYFGSYLPLAAGGVATCVGNTFTGGITGTANVNTSGSGAGTSAGTASVQSRVSSAPTLDEPCPRCVGDGTANDGVQGGTCSSGARAGSNCDASGSSPNSEWGATSLDCPPLAGAKIADLPIDLSNTTGTKTRTLSAANPSCRAPGFTGQKCQCDTCNNAAATPCSSNADCGAGICGGKRCLGGGNNGAACSNSTECPGGACSVPGTATAPNQCDGGVGDCVAGDNSPATSANDHICSTGPFEQFCGPVETFRGCTTNGDCPLLGDTCSVSRFRECYDNGNMGDTVTSTGQADPPSGHISDPTLAALFCVGPTSSGSVNSAAGLPGLGRLELGGHSVDNGTP